MPVVERGKQCGRILLVLVALVTGCQERTTLGDGVHVSRPDLPLALESGMAVLPVALARPLPRGTDVAAFFTDELYTSLLTTPLALDLTPPDEVLRRLGEVEESERKPLFALQRSRMAQRELTAQDCAKVSGLLRERYVFVVWVQEVERTGVEDTAQDLTDARFADDVRRQTYRTVEGQLVGEVVDLFQARVLWQGAVSYASEKLFEGKVDTQMAQHRSLAAYRLVQLLVST